MNTEAASQHVAPGFSVIIPAYNSAETLATACENCHTQLSNLNDHYKMGVEVKFLSSMVADALVR